jgi:drug/metabolite transporter (DMT)-like permease
MASSELPSGILMGAIFLGDQVTAAIAAGVTLVLAGIVLSQLPDLLKLRKHG